MDRKRIQVLSLRTFGCTAYVHVDAEKSDKLDVEAVKCYFIGYGSDTFEYKFCGVTFDENFMYKDKENINSKTTK